MALLIRLIIFFTLLISNPLLSLSKGIKYNHNCETISEIKEKADFTILTPRKLPEDWTLDTKTIPCISLHYMNSNDTKLMVAIDLRRAYPLSDEDFPHSQKVYINGNEGYFQEWGESGKVDKHGDTIAGGILNWVQEGTYVELRSSILSKEKMLKVARSMK